jgi:hypothetical protein
MAAAQAARRPTLAEAHERDPRMGVQRSDREVDVPVNPFRFGEGEAAGAAARRGADGGVASLVLGAVVTLFAPLLLMVTILMAAHGPRGLRMGPSDITLATIGLVICIGLVLLLGVAGLFFGFFGVAAARRHGQPLALPLAGIFLSAAGLVLFFLVSIDTIFVLTWFHRAFP